VLTPEPTDGRLAHPVTGALITTVLAAGAALAVVIMVRARD
jgi:hypothetical protein